jgi:mono/diheme cytochrome c family protein
VVLFAVCGVGGGTLAAAEPNPNQQVQRGQPEPGARTAERVLLDRYCVTCHNGRLQTAGRRLDSADVSDLAADPGLWENVVRKLRAGAMPPQPRPRPDPATYARFIAWLESSLDAVAAAAPNPGRTEAMHRLNRAEYHNVVRDLFDLDVDVAELLPAGSSSKFPRGATCASTP